ncbi:MAG: recombinase family protein [Candidatus Dormiibacterota bacterium]
MTVVHLDPWAHPTGPSVIAAIAEELGAANAANYARISDDPGGRARGVTRQLRDGREVAARLGLQIYDDYVDNDRSGYRRPDRRQDRARLCADIEAGLIRYVIFWRCDRIDRTVRPAEDFIDLCVKHHVLFVTHRGQIVDPSTPEGAKWFRDGVSNSLYESQVQSLRGILAGRDYASHGELNGGGGDRPFGYEQDHRTVRQTEAAVIRTLAARADAGESIRSLCRWLTDQGIPTVRGGPWSPTVLRNILFSARISKRRAYHGEIVAEAKWEGIITPELGDRVRAKLVARKQLGVQPPRRYLLTGGRARCCHCGAGLIARPKEGHRPNYCCAKPPGFSGCGKIAILAEYLEGEVVEQVLTRLNSPAVWEALRHPETGDPQAEAVERIARKRAQVAEADEDRVQERMSREQHLRITSALRAEIDALARRLARTNRVVVFRGLDDGAALRARWAELGIERQQAIVDVLIDHVTVLAANHGRNRPDPHRVDITWKL